MVQGESYIQSYFIFNFQCLGYVWDIFMLVFKCCWDIQFNLLLINFLTKSLIHPIFYLFIYYSQGYRNRTNTSLKMTVNGIMNGWTKYGSKSANTLSVLAVYHTSISYFLDDVVHLDNYIKNSYKLITPLISGSLTGLIFFTPRTVPAATVAALGGATLSYAYNYVKNINFSSKRWVISIYSSTWIITNFQYSSANLHSYIYTNKQKTNN